MNESLKQVGTGVNPMQLAQGIEKGTEAVVTYIHNMAIAIKTSKEIAQIASLSAGNETIGQLVADVMKQTGQDGVIKVEESPGSTFEVEYVEGMLIDQGYLSPYLVPNYFGTTAEKMEAVLDNPCILITDKKISAVEDILPIREKMCLVGKRDIFIIDDDMDGEALVTLVVNNLRGIVNVLVVKAPGVGDCRKAVLRDIAVLTGGQLISEELGKATLVDLGQARRVVASKDRTSIVEGKGTTADILARMHQIVVQRDETTSEDDCEKLQERLAGFAGGVARIKVGAVTDAERTSRKASVEYAFAIAQAAVKEGLVPGDGVALLNAIEALNQVHLYADAATGISILRRSLESPLRQLAFNRGHDASAIIEGVRRAQKDHQSKRYGYNMLTDSYEDLVASGIVDAAKVICSVLQKATRLATTMLMTQTLGYSDAVTLVSEAQQPTERVTPPSQSSFLTIEMIEKMEMRVTDMGLLVPKSRVP